MHGGQLPEPEALPMNVSARVTNGHGVHQVTLQTDGNAHSIDIPPKPTGFGSSANGAELLFLALATCYCNDIYREAAKIGIEVRQVEVEVTGEFGGPGEAGTNIEYTARVTAAATEEQIRELMSHTDTVAEIQNTLRAGTSVTLSHIEAVAV
jgi:organic hydroperoxide reductase OsmC/OhrA